jgi:hypothetical protein
VIAPPAAPPAAPIVIAPPAPSIVFTPVPPAAPAPAAPIVIAPPAAPAPVFIPAPSTAPVPVTAPSPVVETITVKVTLPVVTILETQTAPAELTTQKLETKPIQPIIEPVVEKLLTKVAVSKVPTFTGTGPFKFTLGLSEQANSVAIKDPDLAIGLKVISQTPAVCRVAATFNRTTGKYAITVVGISNGQCRISAIDKGNDEKLPTATMIKQTLSEDYHFCELWRKHGGKVHANPFIKLQHVGTYIFGGDIIKAGGNLK